MDPIFFINHKDISLERFIIKMNFDERVDVFDLIMKVLTEHEKNLDSIAYKLDETLSGHSSLNKQVYELKTAGKYKVFIKKWSEFKEKCMESDLVTFETDADQFKVSAINGAGFYSYSEPIPEFTIRMENCGNRVTIKNGTKKTAGGSKYIFNGKLQCGIGVKAKRVKVELPNGDSLHKITFDIDPENAKKWLAEQLKVDKQLLIYGSIEIK